MPSIRSLVALVMLLAAVEAAPVAPTTQNTASPAVLFSPSPDNSVNDCGDSSFVNQTTGGSPSVSDCLQLASNIAGGGTWTVENVAGNQHQIAQYNSCKFGVQGNGQGNSVAFYVGNQDIMDLIHSSVNMYQWNNLVGSKGSMPCQGNQNDVTVSWGLY